MLYKTPLQVKNIYDTFLVNLLKWFTVIISINVNQMIIPQILWLLQKNNIPKRWILCGQWIYIPPIPQTKTIWKTTIQDQAELSVNWGKNKKKFIKSWSRIFMECSLCVKHSIWKRSVV